MGGRAAGGGGLFLYGSAQTGRQLGSELQRMSGSKIAITDRVRQSETHLGAELDGDVVLMSIANGSYYGLDDVGSDIWRCVKQPVTVATVCDELQVIYASDRNQLERDVLVLLDSLANEGLIEIML